MWPSGSGTRRSCSNRLMFIYFIQRKGFLNGDQHYLRNRLQQMQAEHGKDQFYSFYRYFLLRLFHEGLGGKQRTQDLEKLLGRIPYLNGGMFAIHEIEERYPKIQIPDKAFEGVFDYFDQYQWHLDERPLRNDNEINPDVLGYIFEKYINQKQMGAYYTKEDITGYISTYTIIPFLLDAATEACRVAFENPNGPTIWDLLVADPGRYVYEAVKHGVAQDDGSVVPETVLPDFVQNGMRDPNVRTFDRRYNLEQATEGDLIRLPTETWREYVARRDRCLTTIEKLSKGEVRDGNDLITLNLNVREFIQDVIVNCEDPNLLWALWQAIERITILDPTCGSGAFLFAALNILESLYEACLERMEAFIVDQERFVHGGADGKKFSDFHAVLDRVRTHPNHRYFIFKSIILNNLFGVDIMEEAVEICQLRLFLKLAAQVEPDTSKENMGMEPLPDIEFNIRPGNTLVGFATYEEAKNAVISKLNFDNTMERITAEAASVQTIFDEYRQKQTEGDGSNIAEKKLELRGKLRDIESELNKYLAEQHGVSVHKKQAYSKWLASAKPFHWFVEFYSIMQRGGFDVVIGNPPYVVYSPKTVNYKIEGQNYRTLPTKNLYAFVFERSIELASRKAPVGLIIQLTCMSSERLPSLQDFLLSRCGIYTVPFPRRPESVFEGVEMPVAIVLSMPGRGNTFTSSTVNRFYTQERENAMALLSLVEHSIRIDGYRIAKIGSLTERNIYEKLSRHRAVLEALVGNGSECVMYYQEACRYWVKASFGLPFFRRNGAEIMPPHGRIIAFNNREATAFAACLMNSSLFYWFYSAFSDCEHINDKLLRRFTIPARWEKTGWIELSDQLSGSLAQHAQRKIISTKEGHTIEYDEMKAMYSKMVIDEIDRALAQHYGFTDEELDFIINYDIKYRMGRDADEEDGL